MTVARVPPRFSCAAPVRRAFTIALAVGFLAALGCGTKPRDSNQGRAFRPAAPVDAVEPAPPASPEEAFERFHGARDFVALGRVLAQEPRKRLLEAEHWSKRCHRANRELDALLGMLFGAEPEPSVPGGDYCFRLIPGVLGGWEVVESRPSSAGGVELTVEMTHPRPPRGTPAARQVFKAVVEEGSWRLAPPLHFDLSVGLEDLRRYVVATEALVAELKAGAHPSRAAAVRALSAKLVRGDARPGTPEEALELFEAALFAWDREGLLDRLSEKTRARLVSYGEHFCRLQTAFGATLDAYEERFGPRMSGQRRNAGKLGPIGHLMGNASGDVVGGFCSQRAISDRKMLSDSECELTVRDAWQFGSGAISREVVLLFRKEQGKWKLGVRDDNPRITAVTAADLRKVEMLERLAAELRAGKCKTVAEFEGAYGAALLQSQE